MGSENRSQFASTAVFFLFFVSGCTGLVYEVLWGRRLTLVFGCGLFATSAILAVFMGGLSLGSWWLGRFVDTRSRPLRFYGWLEISIGLYALCIPSLLEAVLAVYQTAYQWSEGAAPLVNLARLVLAALVLLPPTVLMGATLPALSRFVANGRDNVTGQIGTLYALNTAGGVLGCLVTGFVLIEALGLRGVEILTAFINIGIGTVALVIRRAGSQILEAGSRPLSALDESAAVDRKILLVACAVSGFAALGYEVVWTRLLTFFVGNSTYAFTIMLASFLTGLAVGAAVAAKVVDRLSDAFFSLSVVQLLIGLTMCEGLFLFPHTPYVDRLVSEALGSGWFQWILVRFGIAFSVLAIPTFLIGTVFALASRTILGPNETVAADVGTLYACNTLGAIAGALTTGLILVPYLGLSGTLMTLAGLNGMLFVLIGQRRQRSRLFLPLGILTLGTLLFLAPRDAFLKMLRMSCGDGELIYYREEPSATLFVTRSPENERWVHFSDGRGSGGTYNLPGHRFWGHLPALLARERRSACVICFGSGITLGAVASHPFEKIVCAEICEGIREPARLFPENRNVLDDPRVRLVTDDGRNVLFGSADRFDVIVNEPPLLETAGVVNLFSREFYHLVRSRLAPGGVFCQWVPSFEFAKAEHQLVLRTFLEVFPNATFWGSPLYADTMLIGTLEKMRLPFSQIASRFQEPKVLIDLQESNVIDPAHLLAYFGLSADGLRKYCGPGPIMTDDRTVLDFVMPRAQMQPRPYGAIMFWKRQIAVSPDVLSMQARESVVFEIDFPSSGAALWKKRLERIEQAKRLLVSGHISGVQGHFEQQAILYENAFAADPTYSNARFYLALNRLERASRYADAGNHAEARRLASAAAPLATEFPHLLRRSNRLATSTEHRPQSSL